MKLFVSMILENKEKIKSYFVREHSLLIRQSSNESRCISKINNISFVGVVYKRAYTKQPPPQALRICFFAIGRATGHEPEARVTMGRLYTKATKDMNR